MAINCPKFGWISKDFAAEECGNCSMCERGGK